MTDRELLELAAKAAGYDTSHHWNAERLTLDPPQIGLVIRDVSSCWNPIADDGDALRLAVKLHISIRMKYGRVEAGRAQVSVSKCGGDVYQAVRTAVVVAAAERGRSML